MTFSLGSGSAFTNFAENVPSALGLHFEALPKDPLDDVEVAELLNGEAGLIEDWPLESWSCVWTFKGDLTDL